MRVPEIEVSIRTALSERGDEPFYTDEILDEVCKTRGSRPTRRPPTPTENDCCVPASARAGSSRA